MEACVVSTAPPPSVFIVQTDVLAPRALTKRILVPSGDQSGSASSAELPAVRFVGSPVPSAFMVKTSLLPERSESNASLVPSGLQAGLTSAPGASVRFVASPVPLAFMSQIWPALSQAIRLPSGESDGLESAAALFVSRATPVPAGLMV